MMTSSASLRKPASTPIRSADPARRAGHTHFTVFKVSGFAGEVDLLFRPPGLDDLVAAVAAAPAPAVDASVLRSFCRILGRAYVAATIAAGLELVAFLCQVCRKIIEHRLVDDFCAVRLMSLRLRRLDDASDIDVESTAALGRAGDERPAGGRRLRLVKRAAWVSVTGPAST